MPAAATAGLCSSNGGFTPQSFYTSADADIALEVAEENEDNVDCPGGERGTGLGQGELEDARGATQLQGCLAA